MAYKVTIDFQDRYFLSKYDLDSFVGKVMTYDL